MTDNAVVLDSNGIRLGGKYTNLLCASLFYFRLPMELWRDRIIKLKSAGYNCADVYFPWNYHELSPEKWCFEGNADADAFLSLLEDEGIYVVARPGPYICSEWDGGSIPAWLLASDIPVRENNPEYLNLVGKWYDKIIPIIAAHEYGKGAKGTVLFVQIENELDYFDCPKPKEYMETLYDMVRDRGITCPIIGCVGQGSMLYATGRSGKIVPTFNFYPDPASSVIDRALYTVGKTLNKNGIPFMITETSDDHFLLRREFANGAKLMGAYNQVAGINFGFTNSINNWGPEENPLSFVSTMYGSDKMISPYGEIMGEALEGRLFGAFLKTFSEKLASARSAENASIRVTWEGRESGGENRILEMADGGRFLCIPNYADSTQTVAVDTGKHSFRAAVPGRTAPFFGFDVKLDEVSDGFRLVWSSAEILETSRESVVCYGEADASMCVAWPGNREQVIAGQGRHRMIDGEKQIDILLLSRDEAKAYALRNMPSCAVRPPCDPLEVKTGTFLHRPDLFTALPVAKDEKLFMENRGIYRGFARYEADIPSDTQVVVKAAADIISTYAEGSFVDTRISAGQWQKYAPQKGRKWVFRVESWGHSNFDDPRLPALRLKSSKGLGAVCQVKKVEKGELQWRFAGYGQWLPEKLTVEKSQFDPILPPYAWFSTRMPLYGVYYTSVRPEAGANRFAIELERSVNETAVYIDGRFAGVSRQGATAWFDLTDFMKEGELSEIALLCRSVGPHQSSGAVRFYHLIDTEVTVSSLTDTDIAQISARGGEEMGLPVFLKPGDLGVYDLDLDGFPHRCSRIVVKAHDLKLTAVFNRQVVGRIIGDWKEAPFISCGYPDEFYIPGPWFQAMGNRLSLMLEAVGRDPGLTSISVYPIPDGYQADMAAGRSPRDGGSDG